MKAMVTLADVENELPIALLAFEHREWLDKVGIGPPGVKCRGCRRAHRATIHGPEGARQLVTCAVSESETYDAAPACAEFRPEQRKA